MKLVVAGLIVVLAGCVAVPSKVISVGPHTFNLNMTGVGFATQGNTNIKALSDCRKRAPIAIVNRRNFLLRIPPRAVSTVGRPGNQRLPSNASAPMIRSMCGAWLQRANDFVRYHLELVD